MSNQLDWIESRTHKIADTPQPFGTWKYKMMLPRFLAEWDILAAWEWQRVNDMASHLNQGDVLFDVGSEYGWQTAMYAQMVGPSNMVLMEPSEIYWPCIRQIWEKTFEINPLAMVHGLCSNITSANYDFSQVGQWPAKSEGTITKLLSYQYIHEHGNITPQISIDDFVEATGIVPSAITMDVEGAEPLVLHGAETTLVKHKPIIWASLHPEMSLTNYGETMEDLNSFMTSKGYKRKDIAVDHEIHVRFWCE